MKEVKNLGVYYAIMVFARCKKGKVKTKIISDLIIADSKTEANEILGSRESEEVSKLVVKGYFLSRIYSSKIQSNYITELWDCHDSPEPDNERYTEIELKEAKKAAKLALEIPINNEG